MDKAKEAIVQKLKASGCRITKQRLMLLDIILEENCSCCKEIYYRASRIDPSIGTACNFSNSILSEQSFPQRGAGADRQQFSGRLSCLSSAARFGGKGDFFHAEFHF